MLKRAVFLALAASLLAVPASAQTLDEVLGQYYQAIGGADAWRAVTSMRATGRMQMGPGMEAPFTMTQKRPKMIRMEFTYQGMTGVQAYDGESGWMLMPFLGKTEPEPIPPEDLKDIIEQADIEGALVDWQAKGHQVEYVGKETTAGTEAYKLKVTLKGGDVQYYYLDAEYYLPIKVESSRDMRGTVMEFETILSDYKEVGGLMIPHSIQAMPKGAPAGQVITLDSIELNVDVDDSIFHMPAPAGGQ
jgi:outer membrane lipoprotein-sorting protein